MSTFDLAAIHEAGHAVMCWIVDLPFKYVTIKPCKKANTLGHLARPNVPRHIMEDYHAGPCKATEMYMDRLMIVSLAGYAAESLLLEPKKPNSKQSRNDRYSAFDLTDGRFGDNRQVEKEVVKMHKAAVDSLSHYWPHVEALAAELVDKKKVKYMDAIKILEAVRF